MNLFILDKDPILAARYNCDKHCIKIILESAQMMCNLYPKNKSPYRHTHINHPMTKWVGLTSANFKWCLAHAKALCAEYTKRYGKVHKTQAVIEWIERNPPSFIRHDFTEPPQCFGDNVDRCYVRGDAVAGYRKYYKLVKRSIAAWKVEKPYWFDE